jgi:hypothetical protein
MSEKKEMGLKRIEKVLHSFYDPRISPPLGYSKNLILREEIKILLDDDIICFNSLNEEALLQQRNNIQNSGIKSMIKNKIEKDLGKVEKLVREGDLDLTHILLKMIHINKNLLCLIPT